MNKNLKHNFFVFAVPLTAQKSRYTRLSSQFFYFCRTKDVMLQKVRYGSRDCAPRTARGSGFGQRGLTLAINLLGTHFYAKSGSFYF